MMVWYVRYAFCGKSFRLGEATLFDNSMHMLLECSALKTLEITESNVWYGMVWYGMVCPNHLFIDNL